MLHLPEHDSLHAGQDQGHKPGAEHHQSVTEQKQTVKLENIKELLCSPPHQVRLESTQWFADHKVSRVGDGLDQADFLDKE